MGLGNHPMNFKAGGLPKPNISSTILMQCCWGFFYYLVLKSLYIKKDDVVVKDE
ncbi:hypothetical protein [Clostridium arbusti]|uniref:hypothetical protein n=1 Tax=Clostridium arbusti TaxID=1137848 RepID=UPI00030EA06E|nr:hypothetical protein [Clostridium arbusti]